jgi:hypothetical protein
MVEKIKRGIEKRKIIFTIAIAALIIICIGVLIKKPKVELPSLAPKEEGKEGIPTPPKEKEEGIPTEVTTFTIEVIDSSSGELLSGVKVMFDTLTGITDNGTVQFQNQRIDIPHTIRLSKEGYYSKLWTWEPGYKTTIRLDLLKIS